jgi:hypothetical protein
MKAAEKFSNALLGEGRPKGFCKFGPGGLRLVFGHDPYTPCMVYLKDASATFDCAVGEGAVEHHSMTYAQTDWLLSFDEAASRHIDAVRGPNWKG